MNDGLESVVHASTSTLQADANDREKELEEEVCSLREKLDSSNTKRIELEDQLIDLRAQLVAKQQSEKDIKQQLKLLSEFAVNSGSSHQKTVDLKRMYDQILYKDSRIVELNNTIMEKERNIMDLQEMCKEQGQVAQAKSMAVQIVNRRLREFDSRKFADASTETDGNFNRKSFNKREISPGRAIANLKAPNGNGSPPPDPSEDMSSYTTETHQDDVDFEREWSGPTTSKPSRKSRKRVTFDLHGRPTSTSDLDHIKLETKDDLENQNLSQAVVDLSTENDQLRRIIAEMEKSNIVEADGEKIAELEVEAEQARKEGKNQALRARAAAQARIKDLESKLLELRFDSIESLKATVEVLKSSREWAIMENSRLLGQITDGKSKMDDLRGELDSILSASALCRQQLEVEEVQNERLTAELRQNQRHSQQLLDEREFFQNEITRLKGALAAQEELVGVLEGDLIVYEAHVGILRDSLGASKKEDRQVIRSKAFAAKLNAMEAEKQQITKRNNDERLRTKALHVKIRMLEQERDELIFRLQQYEGDPHLADSLSATDDEMNDTKPTFHEQAVLNVTMVESTVSEPPVMPSYGQYLEEKQSPECSGEAIPILENSPERAEIKPEDHSAALIAVLNELMLEICAQLRNHGQEALFEQLEADLAMYQQSPDLEPVVVVQQVQRFVNEVIDSLMHGVSTLRIEKEAIRDQLDLMRIALNDAQSLQMNVENAQCQLEADQIRLDTDWEKVKAMLQQNHEGAESAAEAEEEKNDAELGVDEDRDGLDGQLKDAQDAKSRLEVRIDEMDKRVLEMMVEREQFEVKISQLQTENAQIGAERSSALLNLNEVRQQNTELDHLVETLRSEIDRLRVEAELSRNCLEDLRNSSWRRNPSGSAAAAVAQPPRSVAVPVPLVAPQVIVQNPPVQSNPPPARTQLQSAASSAFVPVAASNRSISTVEEEQPGPSAPVVQPLTPVADYEALSTIALTSQKVADYLKAQTERYNELRSSQSAQQQNSDGQLETAQLNEYEEAAELETVVNLQAQLRQREIEIQQLTERCDEYSKQMEDITLKLTNSYLEFDKQYQQLSEESGGYASEVDQLQKQLTKLASEKMELECQLCQQLAKHENELLQLKNVSSLPTTVDFSQQTQMLIAHSSVQTTAPLTRDNGHDADSNFLSNSSAVQHSNINSTHPNDINFIVEEQRNVLKACLDESEEMEKYMTMAVDRMVNLNSDLESCVESIRAQVISLSGRIVEELNDQKEVASLLVEGRNVSAEQANRLRVELDATRTENSRNLLRISEVEAAYSALQQTFEELTQKYSSLQNSFELSLENQKAEMSDQITETIIDGATIDRLNELNCTVNEMAASSTEAKERLQHCQERIQSLQSLLSTQLFTTQNKLEELRSDEFTALKSSVVSSINEFKIYLLHSFGEVQSALEARQSSNVIARSEMESTERISRALVLCERICNDIAEDSRAANAQAESSVCLETMLQNIHEHWRARQRELAENTRALQEQRHLSEVLEGRLNEAEAQLNAMQTQQSTIAATQPAPSSPLRNSPPNPAPAEAKTNLHLAILAARLSTKQADNDALFRCNSELAHANVHLHAQVEHLQECVQRVTTELDAVSNSISSNSRHSSIGSLPADSRIDEVSVESVLNSTPPNEIASAKICQQNCQQVSVTVSLPPVTNEETNKIPEEEPISEAAAKPAAVSSVPNDEPAADASEWGWDADNSDNERVEEMPTEPQKSETATNSTHNAPAIALPTETPSDSWGWGDDEDGSEVVETKDENNMIADSNEEKDPAAAWAWGEEAETTVETLDTANTENDSDANWDEW